MLNKLYEERMPCLYTIGSDIQQRLDGGIVRYKGEPYYCQYSSPIKLDLWNLWQTERLLSCHPSDPELDISYPELGYVNLNGDDERKNRVIYVKGSPRKQFSQTCRASNVLIRGIGGQGTNEASTSIVYTKGFLQFLRGEFPTLKEVLEKPVMETQFALSPELAVHKMFSGVVLIYFRERNVGFIAPDSDDVTLMRGEFRGVMEKILSRYDLKVR